MLSCQYFVKDEAMPLTLSWLVVEKAIRIQRWWVDVSVVYNSAAEEVSSKGVERMRLQ